MTIHPYVRVIGRSERPRLGTPPAQCRTPCAKERHPNPRRDNNQGRHMCTMGSTPICVYVCDDVDVYLRVDVEVYVDVSSPANQSTGTQSA